MLRLSAVLHPVALRSVRPIIDVRPTIKFAGATSTMSNLSWRSRLVRLALLAATIGVASASPPPVSAAVSFLGVAAGDVSSTEATLWTRAVDAATPANTPLTIQMTTDPTFASRIATVSTMTDSSKDYTAKVDIAGLLSGTVYYYRFVGPSGELSLPGKFKTAPDASASVPLHFAFSGDNDGLMRPYALASVIPSQNLDFYMNLGDVIYETASNLTTSGGHNGAPWLNSPSVTLSNDSLSFNGIPRAFIPGGTPFATQAQLKADYEKKYRENFLPVNTDGQNSLQVLYAAQGNYTTWDNHELGNRKYIDGGAPAGGSVGGSAGTDMPTGRGVDARSNGAGNPGNANDVNGSARDYMNRSTGFQTLQNVFLSYQPIADRGTVDAPTDPRSNGTRLLYSAQQWGKNAIFINTDSRSYRDLRLKTANASADDTSAPRADNSGRTYLGATQLAWLEQTLLDAHNAGALWKFVSVSDPIDQLGPIGGALALSGLPCFYSSGCNPDGTPIVSGTPIYVPVSADGGKSYMGGYRAERNALMKFIADNHITNVVFLATDDHQNRVNEVTYSPSSQTSIQSTYVKVPYAFSIVAGPLGATGPDLITNHTFAMAQQLANSIANAQVAAAVEPLGLIGYPGLRELIRDGDPTAAISPQPVDFYSPDTFNFVILDVSADGQTLEVKSIGMDATAQNAGIEYATGPQARTVFSFKVDTVPFLTRGGFVFDRRLNRIVQQVAITNNSGATLTGPIDLVLTGLSSNTALVNATGTTTTFVPGSPYITVPATAGLTAGASVNVVLQFARPASGGITYAMRAFDGASAP
jgi:phosphodiesterase/alkaline phosphatase D-like protein